MKLNYKKVFNTLVEETKKYITKNNLKAMVLGISGGIDSTVTAAICHEVSKQTGIPLIGRSLPIKNKEDEFDTSKLVGEAFCDDFCVCNLFSTYDRVSKDIKSFEYDHSIKVYNTAEHYGVTSISEGNIQARLRMIYLYNLASIHNGLVMSTDNQTEYQLGFWTIHGDVGDFDPLQDLWKTEVYGLAEWLSNYYKDTLKSFDSVEEKLEYCKMYEAINESIRLTPTDGLGISNSDLDQIGAKSYEEVDTILQDFLAYDELFSENSKKANMKGYLAENALYDIEPEVIKKVIQRHIASKFKRKKAPIYIERKKYC
jgi:NAD+ synthetase